MEYAAKAVENGGTAIGIRCKDGVVLAVEKIITSKLLKPGANKKIATVDRHVGIVSIQTHAQINNDVFQIRELTTPVSKFIGISRTQP